MNSSIQFTILLLSLFHLTHSAGLLRLDLTSDTDCYIQFDGHSTTETVRLFAYETRTIELYSQGGQSELSVRFQLFHHFSGRPLSEVSSQSFGLFNNGLWDSRVFDTETLILSIRSTFHCENGYFGPSCEHRSRQISSFTSTLSTTTSMPTATWSIDFEITNTIVIYFTLSFCVLLVVVANCAYFCCRPSPKLHVYQDIIPVNTPKVFVVDESVGYLTILGADESATPSAEFFDARSKFMSGSTLHSIV